MYEIKKDTHNVESINADLRHYIPILARRSRCFARKIETLYAVVAVFVDAYNRFGLAKYKFQQCYKNGDLPFSVIHLTVNWKLLSLSLI